MARRLDKTLADYMVIAISPALIIALVASLVFFLQEVIYASYYDARLKWVMFLFVAATVLIARISIESGAERAGLFGLALAVVVWIALNRFVEYPLGSMLASFGWLINIGLMALVWWCAHRLTSDCTIIDEHEDASGQGLLEVAGLDGAKPAADESTSADRPVDPPWRRVLGWFGARRRKSGAPGVWVVYFSLAALPLFGLGQILVPADDMLRRRFAFWLLFIYVASGLGLLLTTSFLGLRRYLRQRRLEMPGQIAAVWLGVGGAIAAGLLVAAALIPRPSPEYSISAVTGSVGPSSHTASRIAPLRNTAVQGAGQGGTGAGPQEPTNVQPGKGDGQGGPERPGPNGSSGGKPSEGASGKPPESGSSAETSSPPPKAGEQPASQGPTGDTPPPDGGSTEGSSTDSPDPSQPAESGDSPGEQSGADDPPGGKPPSPSSAQSQPTDPSSPPDKSSNSPPPNDSGKQPSSPPADTASQAKSEPPGKTTPPPESTSDESPPDRTAASQSQPPPASSDAAEPPQPPPSEGFKMPSLRLGVAMRWLLNLALAVAGIYLLWRYRATVLLWCRQFAAALGDLWRRLFGRTSAEASAVPTLASPVQAAPLFAAFHDPFRSGQASRCSGNELVTYSFAALEAWARDQNIGRPAEATPLEFAGQLGERVPQLGNDARKLATFFSRVAYAGETLSNESVRPDLARLWSGLTPAAGQATAAREATASRAGNAT